MVRDYVFVHDKMIQGLYNIIYLQDSTWYDMEDWRYKQWSPHLTARDLQFPSFTRVNV